MPLPPPPHLRPSTLLRLGVVGAVLVLVGGLVTATVPDSSWVDGLALRHSMPGRMSGVVGVVTGLGLLATAWVGLWRGAAAGLLDLGFVRRASALWCLPLLIAPPLFSRDGWSYAAQGELTRIGLSPYVWGPGILDGPIVEAVDPRWMATPTPYGPLPLLFGSGAAELLHGPWLLVVAHRSLALVGLLMLAWALPRLAAWTGRDPAVVSALALPSPLLLAHGVAGLHNDLLMVGLAAVALVVAAERGWAAGAVLGGLAAAVKVPGGLVCVGVALVTLPAAAPLARRTGRLAAVAAVSVATLLGTGALAGVGVGWVHALGVPGQVDTPLSLSGDLAHLVPGAKAVGVLLALGIVVWSALRTPTGAPAAALHAAALALTATVLLSPVVHPWYALWCVPLLAACRLGPRGEALLIGVSLTLGVTAPLDASLPGAPLAIVVACALVAVSAAVRWRPAPSQAAADVGWASTTGR